METGLGHGKLWKVNQMVAAFMTRVHVSGLCVHYHCLLSDSVWRGSAALSIVIKYNQISVA